MMETISAAHDSSSANPSSVKSDDSSPRARSGSGSPPPNCAICLGTCKNNSFTDSCLHQFCFTCLLTWSKVKAECPLCKQNFKAIIHNVRSNQQYEKYVVEQRPQENVVERIDIDNLSTGTPRFRYRTTLTLPRSNSDAIHQLLLQLPLVGEALPVRGPPPPRRRRRSSPASFRRNVYRHNLWARPLPDITGRFRDCSPEFYRFNNAQIHRLVPWLNRELNYLLNENAQHIAYVLTIILDLLPQYHINSVAFRDSVTPYFGNRTEHFVHELYCFASTPYDMMGYDRNVQYTTDTRLNTIVNELLSNSDSESADSDIVMISSSEPAGPRTAPGSCIAPAPGSRIAPAPETSAASAPGPSRPPLPVYPPNFIPNPNNSVIPIETISHSDSDDSEVMVVGYIKPPQDRTPEVVDLLGSDSDVVLQEPQPGPSQADAGATALVRLSLRRHPPPASDSDDAARTPPPPPRPSLPYVAPSPRLRRSRSWSISASIATSPPPSSDSDTRLSNTRTHTDVDNCTSYYSSESSPKPHRTKTRRMATRATTKSKQSKKRKTKSRKSRKRKRSRSPEPERNERSKKKKARSSKEIKNSKRRTSRNRDTPPLPALNTRSQDAQPGPSGCSNEHNREPSRTNKHRRGSNGSNRLNSVVKVVTANDSTSNDGHTNSNSDDSNSSVHSSLHPFDSHSDSDSLVDADGRRMKSVVKLVKTTRGFISTTVLVPRKSKSRRNENVTEELSTRSNNRRDSADSLENHGDSSDSEDDRPLNLTVTKT